MLLLLHVVVFVSPWLTSAQFPAICNTPESLQTKTCCPDNCGGPTRGSCENITAQVTAQWEKADSGINAILNNAPNHPQKGTADSRYLWPTVVFERICVCNRSFGGVGCGECDFGWTGSDCSTQKTPVIRKSFVRLTAAEKQTLVNATRDLKNEMGHWSVIVEEPANYTSGTVTLQNVSTYDFFVYLHYYMTREFNDPCIVANNFMLVDFAHAGPVFPVWHRRFLLVVEKSFQRITNNASFGIPYWQWEENDMSPFATEYYGIPSNNYDPVAVNVSGNILNPDDWHTMCDLEYRNPDLDCSEFWRLCNPANDLAAQRPLQRGGGEPIHLPNRIEVKIALAAPSYDAADTQGRYIAGLVGSPPTSFRSRLEGSSSVRFCSAMTCTRPDGEFSQMHNAVHTWVSGHMEVISGTVNDPIFHLHHSNIDRILESWLQRFAGGSSNPALLPAYVPVSGAHPGHNRDDYMVGFVPLITAGGQYRVAEDWGYQYDELIVADILDNSIPDCSSVIAGNNCPICDANRTCIDCTTETCPAPVRQADANIDDTSALLPLGLGLGLGLGMLLLVAIAIIIILSVFVFYSKNSAHPSSGGELEMRAVKT